MINVDPKLTNILMILADDHGHWALGCVGNPEIRTPNLDRLAKSGTRFENFFCVSPVCSPARASLLTGRIPSYHGVHDWIRKGNSHQEGDTIEYLKGLSGYTDVLKEQGYICGLSGKWHLGNAHLPQKGFSFWKVHATGGGSYRDTPMINDREVYSEKEYITDVITKNGLAFLDQQKNSNSPFYLGIHYTAPHSPWAREEHPLDIYDSYYQHAAFDSVPYEPMHPWQINSCPVPKDKESRRQILSGYFSAITAMDNNIGILLDYLEQNQLRANTLVIFTSDNGMNMGHHGIWGKGNGTFPQNLFDTSVKVPAIFSHPGRIPQARVSNALLSHYDLRPTLLHYLGLTDPEASQLPGENFSKLLEGQSEVGRSDLVVFDEYGPVRMIRSNLWKYIHRFPDGPNEMYDLQSDPNEKRNLIDNLDFKHTQIDLNAKLNAWFLKYSLPNVDGIKETPTGKGQVSLAGKGKGSYAQDWHYLDSVQKHPK